MPFEILQQDGYLQARLFGVVIEEDLRLLALRMQEIEVAKFIEQSRQRDMRRLQQQIRCLHSNGIS